MPALRGLPRAAAALLLAFASMLALGGCGASSSPGAAVSSAGARSGGSPGAVLAPESPTTTMRTVPVSALPPEAVATLAAIAAGGPFRYSKDGSTFGNREGRLPRQPGGFYREYTVETPGSDDRGARRVVAGRDGSRFYTDDHYASFREVVAG